MSQLFESARQVQAANRSQLVAREDNNRVKAEAARQIEIQRKNNTYKPKKVKDDKWKGAVPEYKRKLVLPKRRNPVGSYLLVPDSDYVFDNESKEFILNFRVRNLKSKYHITNTRIRNLYTTQFLFSGKNNFLFPGGILYNSEETRPGDLINIDDNTNKYYYESTADLMLKEKKELKDTDSTFEWMVYLPPFIPDDCFLQNYVTPQLGRSHEAFAFDFRTVTSGYIYYGYRLQIYGFLYKDGYVFSVNGRLADNYNTLFGKEIPPGMHHIAVCYNKKLNAVDIFLNGKRFYLELVAEPIGYTADDYLIKDKIPVPFKLDDLYQKQYLSRQPFDFIQQKPKIDVVNMGSFAYGNRDTDLLNDPLNRPGIKNIRYTEKILYRDEFMPPESITSFA